MACESRGELSASEGLPRRDRLSLVEKASFPEASSLRPHDPVARTVGRLCHKAASQKRVPPSQICETRCPYAPTAMLVKSIYPYDLRRPSRGGPGVAL